MHSHVLAYYNLAEISEVLILVLMEDALALCNEPLCNSGYGEVLILVLMEDALALCFQPETRNFLDFVLILVLMEDALAHYKVVAR